MQFTVIVAAPTPKKKPLPDTWRVVLDSFEESPTNHKLAACFDVSPTVVYRWRRESPEFADACEKILKKPKRKTSRKKLITNMSPDDIDGLLFDLLGAPNETHTRQARIAIRQLRWKKREVMSDANRLRHVAHIRTAGNGRHRIFTLRINKFFRDLFNCV